jgi:murein DD-endopeptidase MepM/ murein hydrolase activator NlpD
MGARPLKLFFLPVLIILLGPFLSTMISRHSNEGVGVSCEGGRFPLTAHSFPSLLIPSWGAVWAEEVDPKRQELWDINTKLQVKRQELEQLKLKQDNTLRNLAVINRRLKSTQSELRYADSQLQHHEQLIRHNQQELDQLKENYLMRRKILEKRLRDIYKENRLGYLTLLFSAQTMGDFANKMFYLERIVAADIAMLRQLGYQQGVISQKEKNLRQRYSELAGIKELFKRRKNQFQSQQAFQNRIYSDLARKRREYERQIAELEQNSKEIENLIVKILSLGQGSAVKGSGRFIWPVRGPLTSGYGYRKHPIFRSVRFHTGLDIGVRYGTAVAAADNGLVIFGGWWGGYGMVVIIDHGNGYSTVYAHLSRLYVKKGQQVKKGQVVAASGSTGYSTGPHVHFEIRKNGATTNPLRFL